MQKRDFLLQRHVGNRSVDPLFNFSRTRLRRLPEQMRGQNRRNGQREHEGSADRLRNKMKAVARGTAYCGCLRRGFIGI